ncbi:MAG: hypothetical protein AAGH99_15490 [Planctomycetota bacterium]
MHQVLKLTITAVGEPDSIFLVPCEPITLHESEVESAKPAEDGDSVFQTADDDSSALASPEVMILADEPPLPASRRQAS